MKYYFGNKDSEIAYTKEHFKDLMKEMNISGIEVYMAIPEKIRGVFWCKEFCEWGELNDSICGKICKKYTPRNGKTGICKHWSNISFTPGEKIILKL